MGYTQIELRTAEKILRKNGYYLDRTRGRQSGHRHYVKDKDRVILTVKVNPMIWRRLCKEHNLFY